MKTIKKVIQYLIITVVSLISVFPILWMAISATNTSLDVTRGVLVPGTNLITNWNNLLQAQNIPQGFINSLRNSLIQTLISILICSIAGYGFEIFHDKKKDKLMLIVLLSGMIPFVALMIPLFQIFSKIGLLNSTLGFVLPSLASPFLILMFRQSSRSFPRAIIESARIDGLSEFGIFFRIYIPNMKPTYAAAAVVVFMNSWNNYLWPKVIMLENDKATMPMMVSNLVSGYVTDYGVLMLGVLISSIPTIVVFFILQRYFVIGLTGSVKG